MSPRRADRGLTRFCPVCRTDQPSVFLPGPGGKPDLSCPGCMSLKRERFLALLLDCLAPLVGAPGLLLDVAPSNRVTPLLQALEPRVRVGLDFDPGADGRLVDVQASVTDIPLRDDTVDLMLCYHVLEHVPDDAAAIAEIARVLAPNGVAIVQVPWRKLDPTIEDPDAPVEERIRRFGQADHVRFYGRDFEDRLMAGGLAVRRITPLDLVGEAACTYFHLNPDETVWLVSPGSATAVVPHQGSGALGAALEHLIERREADARETERRLAELQQAWQARYAALEAHWLLRGYRRLRRPVAKALRRR